MMNEETRDLQIQVMKEDISQIKEQIESLPDAIASRLLITTDLKIELEITKAEKKFYKWVVTLGIGFISELVLIIVEFIIGRL